MSRESKGDRWYRFFNPASLCNVRCACALRVYVCERSYTVTKANSDTARAIVSCVNGVALIIKSDSARGICRGENLEGRTRVEKSRHSDPGVRYQARRTLYEVDAPESSN